MSDENVRVEIKEFVENDLSKYTLIEGFPGIGLVGTIASKYLIEKLGMKKIGFIDSDIFIPIIRVREGKPVHPSRIFVDDKRKMVVIISEQIIPNRFMDDFARAVVDWVAKKKIKRIISMSGIHVEGNAETRESYGIGANQKSVDFLKKYNIKTINEGITSGITALILLEFKKASVEAVSLLGTVKVATDYKAAAEVLKQLNDMLSLNLDIKPLLKEAKQVEAELTKFLEKMKQEKQKVEEMEERPAPQGPSYYA